MNCTCVFLLIFALLSGRANAEPDSVLLENNSSAKQDVVAASGVRCDKSPFLVAIDTGHSPAKPGATSARGKKEYIYNKEFVLALVEALTDRGVASYRINAREQELGLRQRRKVAIAQKAQVFISIHHDSVQEHYLKPWEFEGQRRQYCDSFRGFSVFVSGTSAQYQASIALAEKISTQLRLRGDRPTLHHAEPIKGENRQLIDSDAGIYRWDGLGVLKGSAIPAVLLEVGVIVNREEELNLQDPQVRRQKAAAIADGIVAFCSEQ